MNLYLYNIHFYPQIKSKEILDFHLNNKKHKKNTPNLKTC